MDRKLESLVSLVRSFALVLGRQTADKNHITVSRATVRNMEYLADEILAVEQTEPLKVEQPDLEARFLVYIAGPYRDERGAWYVRRNIKHAENVAVELASISNLVPVCPHKAWSGWDGLYEDKVFLSWGLAVLARCDFLILLSNWTKSEGAKAEREFAVEHNIPVFVWPEQQVYFLEAVRCKMKKSQSSQE